MTRETHAGRSSRTIMKRTIALLAAAAALWASASASIGSGNQAQAAAATTYATVLKQITPLPSAGEFPGRLNLAVSGDGIVSGWYVPDYDGDVQTVTGGKTGHDLWLEIGNRGAFHVNAVVRKDGSIVGTATQFGTDMLLVDGTLPSFSFVATPRKSY